MLITSKREDQPAHSIISHVSVWRMWVFPSPTDGTATSRIKSQSDFGSHCETWWQLTTFVCVFSRMFISILTLLHHMLTEHQVKMIVPGLRILLPFMKVFLYFYISFFCCSIEAFSPQGNSSNYSVSRPAEGSRLPNTVCGPSAYSSASIWPRLVLYVFAVTIQALYYKPITKQTSAVLQQTAVSICHIQCLESDQTEKKLYCF